MNKSMLRVPGTQPEPVLLVKANLLLKLSPRNRWWSRVLVCQLVVTALALVGLLLLDGSALDEVELASGDALLSVLAASKR